MDKIQISGQSTQELYIVSQTTYSDSDYKSAEVAIATKREPYQRQSGSKTESYWAFHTREEAEEFFADLEGDAPKPEPKTALEPESTGDRQTMRKALEGIGGLTSEDIAKMPPEWLFKEFIKCPCNPLVYKAVTEQRKDVVELYENIRSFEGWM